MGYYQLFKYGSGVLYGPQAVVHSVDPLEGPAPGGNRFVILGEGFDPRQWDDYFTGAVLDPLKWTDASTGSGSITVGADHLQMSTGTTPASIAGVQSVKQWGDTQGEVRMSLSAPTANPSSNVALFALNLFVDSSNFAAMVVYLSDEGNLRLECGVYVGGSPVDLLKIELPWTTGLSMFKILRWGTDVYFIANGSVVMRSVRYIVNPAHFVIYSFNGSASYDVDVARVEWFYYRPFAVFQNQPVHDTVVVSDKRVRGLVPASRDDAWQSAAYEGEVDVSVVGNDKATSRDSYRYYYVDGLRSINSAQSGVEMDIVNDTQLVTPSDASKGLGGGY